MRNNKQYKTKTSPKEDIDFGKRYARSQYSFIIGKPKDRRIAYYKIKSHLQYPDLCQAADFIDKNIPTKFKELIFGHPLPQGYSELGACEFSSITKSLFHEINWILISIITFIIGNSCSFHFLGVVYFPSCPLLFDDSFSFIDYTISFFHFLLFPFIEIPGARSKDGNMVLFSSISRF